MNSSPSLIVNHLYLLGTDNTYEAHFHDGLNIIWGDMDSGKSSILNLIDYCLGGSNKHLGYDEIKAKGRTAFLDITLNGHNCTFERNIADEDAPIKVYNCKYESISQHYPMLMTASSTKEMPDGWVSDFILDKLNIAKVKIRESKNRAESDSYRLSFRDLMKHLYLRQTQIGSESLLNYGNFAVFNKNIEVQKFIYNIHDDRLSDLQQDLISENIALKELITQEAVITSFLRSINIPLNALDQIHKDLESKEHAYNQLAAASTYMENNFQFSSDFSIQLGQWITSIKIEIEEINKQINYKKTKIRSLSALRKSYESDLKSLNVSKSTRTSLDNLVVATTAVVSCPLCDSTIPLVTPFITDDYIANELRSIKNRVSGVEKTIEKLWLENERDIKDLNERELMINDMSQHFEELNINNISPLVANIKNIESQKMVLKTDIVNLSRSIGITNRLNDISEKIGNKSSIISKLKRLIDKISEELKGVDEVLKDLNPYLENYIQASGLQRVHGVYYDKKFVPHFRNTSYYDNSSGGVRTIMSIASFMARLEYILENESNLPSFIMIDTPGQNIGRYRREDEYNRTNEKNSNEEDNVDPESSDPALYEIIYKQISRIINKAQQLNLPCQIIVVDNDFPHSLDNAVDYHLVKRFSKKGGDYEKGLINDF